MTCYGEGERERAEPWGVYQKMKGAREGKGRRKGRRGAKEGRTRRGRHEVDTRRKGGAPKSAENG